MPLDVVSEDVVERPKVAALKRGAERLDERLVSHRLAARVLIVAALGALAVCLPPT